MVNFLTWFISLLWKLYFLVENSCGLIHRESEPILGTPFNSLVKEGLSNLDKGVGTDAYKA